MSLWNTFAPHIAYLFGIVALFFASAHCAKHRGLLVLGLVTLGYWTIYTLVLLLLVSLLPLEGLLRPRPTAYWKKEAEEAPIVIILGFGYQKDDNGQMKPGPANEHLLRWAFENTNAATFLVQEGVWIAACDSSAQLCEVSGRQLRRIHTHSEAQYLNTLETAYCALGAMQELGKEKAVLVTHPSQLQRTLWDFEAVKGAREQWAGFRFIVPNMPDIPYVPGSVHCHTRAQWIWQVVEMLVARPRDYVSPIPTECKAPLP